jgi:hypothetical protein
MSVGCAIILLNLTKGKIMGNISDYLCTVCMHEPRTNVDTLCDTHYFEWAEEKTYNDFDRSTEGLYL